MVVVVDVKVKFGGRGHLWRFSNEPKPAQETMECFRQSKKEGNSENRKSFQNDLPSLIKLVTFLGFVCRKGKVGGGGGRFPLPVSTK